MEVEGGPMRLNELTESKNESKSQEVMFLMKAKAGRQLARHLQLSTRHKLWVGGGGLQHPTFLTVTQVIHPPPSYPRFCRLT
jgi:hypothetical protein